MIWDKSTSLFDFVLYCLSFSAQKSTNKTSKPRHIGFVGEFLPPRIPRMAKWLKREQELELSLICHQRGYVAKYNDPAFDRTLLFRNKWHLKRILKAHTFDLLHGFAPKSYYCNVARKSIDCPYVHDMQDVYATYYGLQPSLNWLKMELPHERECLLKADAVVAHCLEANISFRKYGIHPKPPSLFFPLYCDDDFFQPKMRKQLANEIHIVYAGGVAGSHRNPKQYGNTQFHALIEILSKQELHFHIYPSPSNIRADYEEYEEIAKTNPYFHFHEPVSQQALAKTLNQYDFGILPFFKELSEQSADKLKYATTLKLFNYLEAGIPIIVSTAIDYQAWLVNRSKTGLLIQLEDRTRLREKISKLNYSVLLQSVEVTRKKWALSLNTKRLISFYDSLLKAKQ